MRKKIVTKEAIIALAENIIRDEGIEKCSMRRLAKDLGIGAGTIYNYYGTRDGLLTDVFHHSWNKTFSNARGVINDSANVLDGLKRFYQIIKRDIKDRNGLGNMLISNSGVISSTTTDTLKKELISIIEAILREHNTDLQVLDYLKRWILMVLMDSIVEGYEFEERHWKTIEGMLR